MLLLLRETMQKVANDRIGPKLESLVQENQKKLLKKKEECDKVLVQKTAEYKEILQHDYEKALKTIREVI